MNRPPSIINFERCYLAAVAVGLIGTALGWHAAMAQAMDNPASAQFGPAFVPALMIATVAITIGVQLVLWHFAARQGAVVAKWIITAFFVIGVGLRLITLVTGRFPFTLVGIVSLLGTVLSGAAVYFLFRPDARLWFGETKA